MLPVALALLVWAPAVVGFGAFWRTTGAPLARLGMAGLVGLAALSTAALALHLFVPVSPFVSLAALGAGWVLAGTSARRLCAGLGRRDVALAAGAILVLAALTQLPGRHYDAGLYQLQSVAWMRGWPQIEGLASLHRRLGFNSSWLALAAILETPWLVGRAVFFLNALPVLFTLFLAVDALRQLRAGRRTASAWYLAASVFAAFLGVDGLGSLNTDPPVVMLGVLSLGLMLRGGEEPGTFGESALAGLVLALFAVTVKLSAVVLPGAWVVLLAASARRLSGREWRLALGAGAALLVPWLVHGLLASGCLLFPVPASCLPLPWATPLEAATEASSVRGWARAPGPGYEAALAGWAWLPTWIRNETRQPHLLIPLVGAAAGMLWLRGRLLAPIPARTPLLVAWTGALFWFLSAPSPRFGLVYLLPAAMLPLATAAAERGPALAPLARRLALALAAVAAVLYLHRSVRPIRKVRPATAAVASWPVLPAPALERRLTSSGTAVTTPVAGDQCWDAPPPCTPYFDARLRFEGRRMVVERGAP